MHGLMFGGFKVSSFYMGRDRTPDWYRSAGNHRIATHLRRQGWDIECLDYLWSFTDEELQNYVDERITKDTVFIGISIIFFAEQDTLDTMTNLINYVKKKYPWVKIISGGVKTWAITSIKADYYIAGNGEYAIDALLKYIMGRGEKPKFKIIETTNAHVMDGYDDYPCYPKRDAAISYEERDFIEPCETLNIELGRGCRFACKYCTYPLIGLKGNQMRDEESVHQELKENWEKWGVQSYYITDDTVNDSKQKMKMLGDAVRRLPFVPMLNGYARADLMISHGKETWDDMIDGGFTSFSYGVESLNHESAKAMGKGMHPDKIKDGLLEMQDYFLENTHHFWTGSLTMIAGLPYESFDTLDATKSWLNKYWMDNVVGYLPLYLQYDDEGVVDEIDDNITADFIKYGYTFEDRDVALSNITNINLLETFQQSTKNKHYNKNKKVDFNFWIHPSGDYGWADVVEWVRDFSLERYAKRIPPSYCFEGASAWMSAYEDNNLSGIQDYYRAHSKEPRKGIQMEFVQRYRKNKLSYK